MLLSGGLATMRIGLIFHIVQMQVTYGRKGIYMPMKKQKEGCENNARCFLLYRRPWTTGSVPDDAGLVP